MGERGPERRLPFGEGEEGKERKVTTKSGQEIEISKSESGGMTIRGLEEPPCPACDQGLPCKEHRQEGQEAA